MLAPPGRGKQGEDSAKACKAVASPGISQVDGLCLAVWLVRGEEMDGSARPPACRTHGNYSLFMRRSLFGPCLLWTPFTVSCCLPRSRLRDVHNARSKPIRVWGIRTTAVFELCLPGLSKAGQILCTPTALLTSPKAVAVSPLSRLPQHLQGPFFSLVLVSPPVFKASLTKV